MSAKKRRGYPRLTSGTRRAIRAYVIERDGRRCFYCGTGFADDLSDVTLDHYIPYSLWPMNKPRNLRLACEPCNTRKADALPWPFVLVLLATFRPENFAPAA